MKSRKSSKKSSSSIELHNDTSRQEAEHTHTTDNDQHVVPLHLGGQAHLSCITLIEDERCLAWLQKGKAIKAVRFSKTQWRLLLALCHCYPHDCPYDELLASALESPREVCHSLLQRAEENGTREETLRPLRNHLYRMKKKLHAFHLSIASVYDAGYVLRME